MAPTDPKPAPLQDAPSPPSAASPPAGPAAPPDATLAPLAEALTAFRARLQAAARKQKGPALRRERFSTDADVDLPDVYTPIDAPRLQDAAGYLSALGLPGDYPFTRGIQATMHRGRLWTMRQYAGFGSAAESNQRYHYLLSRGQTGLSVAFDLPTQMGRDPDHPLARGEVGRVGVSIASLDDMEVLLAGLPLERITTSMTINATASTLLCLYIAVADARGVPRKALGGTVQNDILKEYIARGTYIYPPRPSLRLTTDLFAFCREEVPSWNTISISGYHIREAGSDAIQEVAFTLADGIAYVQAALLAGLHVDEFAPRLSFFFNAHNNLLEEVAKFRAARRLWARIMRDRFGARDARSLMLRFHAQTAGSMLTAQQPLVNVVRTTVQALAAVLGGCQSLHTNAYDEALALPTEESALLALRTQQVLAYESGVADVVDGLGGSYAVESLTDAIEAGAQGYLDRIDELGGMVAAVEQRYPQREIERRAYEYQRSLETATATSTAGERRARVQVGVNEFVTPPPPKDPRALEAAHQLAQQRAASEAQQVQRVQDLRSRRAQDRAAEREAQQALAALTQAAQNPGAPGAPGAASTNTQGENLVVLILRCVKARATVGEIADALRRVFGEHDSAA